MALRNLAGDRRHLFTTLGRGAAAAGGAAVGHITSSINNALRYASTSRVAEIAQMGERFIQSYLGEDLGRFAAVAGAGTIAGIAGVETARNIQPIADTVGAAASFTADAITQPITPVSYTHLTLPTILLV